MSALVFSFRPRGSQNGEGPGPAEKRRRRALWSYKEPGEQPGKTKRCAGCRFYKPLSAFYASRKSPDGRQARCIACDTERAKTRNKEWRSPHVEPHRVGGEAPIANDVERGLEPEPEESDFEEGKLAVVVARSVAAYDRATRGERGRQFKSTPWWIEDDVPIERHANEVLAELRAGRTLREALKLANRDLPEGFAEDRPIRWPEASGKRLWAARAPLPETPPRLFLAPSEGPAELQASEADTNTDSDSGERIAPLALDCRPPSAARPARPRAPKAERSSTPSSEPPRGPERAPEPPPSALGMTRNPHPDLPEISMSDDDLDQRLLTLLQKGPIARRDAVAELKVPVAQLNRVYRRLWDAGKAHARGMARNAVWVLGPAPTGAVGKRTKTIAQIAKKLPKPRRRVRLVPPAPTPGAEPATAASLREKAEALDRKAARLREVADMLEEIDS